MREFRDSKLALAAIALIAITANGCLTLTTSDEGSGGAGTTPDSGSSSGNKPCNSDSDCPTLSECIIRGCVAGKCETTANAPAGTTCQPGTMCDGMGACVDCLVDGDCQADATCIQNACVSCSDGLQNGDETGVDCGGAKCQKCAGSACSGNAECLSGYCVDGVCCSASCIGTCMTCNATGNAGQCVDVPNGQEDPGTCTTTQACDGTGICKRKNGQQCMMNAECLSGKCAMGTCSP